MYDDVAHVLTKFTGGTRLATFYAVSDGRSRDQGTPRDRRDQVLVPQQAPLRRRSPSSAWRTPSEGVSSRPTVPTRLIRATIARAGLVRQAAWVNRRILLRNVTVKLHRNRAADTGAAEVGKQSRPEDEAPRHRTLVRLRRQHAHDVRRHHRAAPDRRWGRRSAGRPARRAGCELLVHPLALRPFTSVGIRDSGRSFPWSGTSFASVATLVAIVTWGGSLPAAFRIDHSSAAIGLAITPFFSRIIRFFPRW